MARRAIKELYGEISALKKEFSLLQQHVRVSIDRPRIDLDALIPETPPVVSSMNPDAIEFVPTLGAALPEYWCAFGPADRPPRPSAVAIPAKPPFRDYYRDNFKGIDVFSLPSLVGSWERLSDDRALDRAIDMISCSDFHNLLALIQTYPTVGESIQQVLPIYTQREEATFVALERQLVEKQDSLDENLQSQLALRDRASRLHDSPSKRRAAGELLRDIEAGISDLLTMQASLQREKADAAKRVVQQKLRVRLWKELGPALQQMDDDRVAALSLQWQKAGLQ